eukprot:1158922-Pelagomonas_calceolata.AAC.2
MSLTLGLDHVGHLAGMGGALGSAAPSGELLEKTSDLLDAGHLRDDRHCEEASQSALIPAHFMGVCMPCTRNCSITKRKQQSQFAMGKMPPMPCLVHAADCSNPIPGALELP